MNVPKQPKSSRIEKIMQAEREREMATYAAKQLADFIGSAVRVLGQPETRGDKNSLLIPLDDNDEWHLDLNTIVPITDQSEPTQESHYSLRLHHMLGSANYDDVTETVNVELQYDYWEVSDSGGMYDYQEIVDLTHLVVAGVRRYEQQNNIASPPVSGHQG